MIEESLFLNVEEDFNTHLSIPHNERIMFSGPFGIGKTTFLNYFFGKKAAKQKYNVIHLSPVHYSVLSNEDVFRYIKYDILYELMELKLLNADQSNFDAVRDIAKYSNENILQLSSLLLLLIPKMGRQLFQLSAELEKTFENFSTYMAEENKEKLAIAELLNSANKFDGDLYEFNLTTQIINDTLKNAKKSPKDSGLVKKNILIIDDIDRIDPNHIFRIFNVFSAHFSVSKNIQRNKFGFDHVILVCDNKNIKNIFEHYYGVKTDYNGYIDKFYSIRVFNFNNREQIRIIVDKVVENIKIDGVSSDISRYYDGVTSHSFNVIRLVFKRLVRVNQLNLRTLFKYWDTPIILSEKTINLEERVSFKNWQLSVVILLDLLAAFVGNKVRMREILQELEDLSIPMQEDYYNFMGEMLLVLDSYQHRFSRQQRGARFSYKDPISDLDLEYEYGNDFIARKRFYYGIMVQNESNQGLNVYKYLRETYDLLTRIGYY